jgi:hypothetical protein
MKTRLNGRGISQKGINTVTQLSAQIDEEFIAVRSKLAKWLATCSTNAANFPSIEWNLIPRRSPD